MRRLTGLLLRLGATGLLMWPVALALLDAYGLRDRAEPADAIVVLGSRVYAGGRPGPALERRTRHAVALYEQGLAPILVCTGGSGQAPPTEAEVACGLAERLGVPAKAVLLESEAHSTEENALYTAGILRARGWRTAIVVSDGYHLFRAGLLFRAAGLVPYLSPAQATAGPMSPIERYARETRELAALAWYWGKTLAGSDKTDFP